MKTIPIRTLVAFSFGASILIGCGALTNSSDGSNGATQLRSPTGNASGSTTSSGSTGSGTTIPYTAPDMSGHYIYQDSTLTFTVTISGPSGWPPGGGPVTAPPPGGAEPMEPATTGIVLPLPPIDPPSLTRNITVTADCTAEGQLQDEELKVTATSTDGAVTIDNDFLANLLSTCTQTKLAVQRLLSAASYSATASDLLLFGPDPATGSEIAQTVLTLRRLPVVDPPPPPPVCNTLCPATDRACPPCLPQPQPIESVITYK
jgi:hypothetical protein